MPTSKLAGRRLRRDLLPVRLAGLRLQPEDSVPVLWSSRAMSSRAFLNSFMLCPRLRAKSGNFFAPKRTRTIRRMINRSGPPRFPIPNARIFITILNWLSPMLYSPEPAHIFYIMHRSLSTIWSPCPEPEKIRIAFVRLSLLGVGCDY